jgi:hypothetical protein
MANDKNKIMENRSHGEKVFKKLSVGIDFTFNTIKNVKKVQWKDEAPWFREVSDGFCWLAYCHNNDLSYDQAVAATKRAEGVNMPQNQTDRINNPAARSQQRYQCPAYAALVVINRGFEVLNLKQDHQAAIIKCPCCLSSSKIRVRNCGFVNCEWSMRGVLKTNQESKVYADGRTYDNKLYTFKEADYFEIWHNLDIMAKRLDVSKTV